MFALLLFLLIISLLVYNHSWNEFNPAISVIQTNKIVFHWKKCFFKKYINSI